MLQILPTTSSAGSFDATRRSKLSQGPARPEAATAPQIKRLSTIHKAWFSIVLETCGWWIQVITLLDEFCRPPRSEWNQSWNWSQVRSAFQVHRMEQGTRPD